LTPRALSSIRGTVRDLYVYGWLLVQLILQYPAPGRFSGSDRPLTGSRLDWDTDAERVANAGATDRRPAGAVCRGTLRNNVQGAVDGLSAGHTLRRVNSNNTTTPLPPSTGALAQPQPDSVACLRRATPLACHPHPRKCTAARSAGQLACLLVFPQRPAFHRSRSSFNTRLARPVDPAGFDAPRPSHDIPGGHPQDSSALKYSLEPISGQCVTASMNSAGGQ